MRYSNGGINYNSLMNMNFIDIIEFNSSISKLIKKENESNKPKKGM